jgi:spore coat protein A, manganese oxidase
MTQSSGRVVGRRSFLVLSATGVLTLYAGGPGAQAVPVASARPATLPLGDVPKFVSPVLQPPAMPRVGRVRHGGRQVEVYRIAMRQFQQQVLPSGWPATTVWGYGPEDVGRGQVLFHAPSLTIEAEHGVPVRVTWVNGLVDAQGRHLPHLLPVDPTLHWANPEQRANADGRVRTDQTPGFAGLTYVPPEQFTDPETEYTAYQGPVPIVTHLHGAMGVGEESDGYTEAWYLPDASDLPDGYARQGRWYDHFRSAAEARFGVPWRPGEVTFQYPNDNPASTLWFHDHALGLTRTNVYAGPAGFYIVRGGPRGDAAVTDSLTGRAAVLPGPAPGTPNQGSGRSHQEILLAVQDRSFTDTGQLFYPDSRAHFDGYEGPYLPDSPIPPIWNPEFFGNTLIVNGRTWPFLEVEQRRYRLRVLNGCGSRFLILDFSTVLGASVWQIGGDGGFLDAPLDLTGSHDSQVLLGPAERADLIVDFTSVPLGAHVLTNLGPDEPYGGGVPGVDFDPADPASTGQVLEFRVVPRRGADRTTPPQRLVLPPRAPLPEASTTRRLALIEHLHAVGEGDEAPVAAMLGVVHHDHESGMMHADHRMWEDEVTEVVDAGATETWEIYNLTADAHPVHVHEVSFDVVDRQGLVIDEEGHGFSLAGDDPLPPMPWENGRKDTVIAFPEQVTRIRATFATPGRYVWHCHILEHEDNEMMRPLQVGPVRPGAPD